MSVAIRIESATLAHATVLAATMRPEDVAELLASGWATPLAALEDCLTLSGTQSWTALMDGKVMAMFGLVPVALITGTACPWLLTSDLVSKYPLAFHKAAKTILTNLMLPRYPRLTNMVDGRYTKTLDWARRLGFRVATEPLLVGPRRMPFYQIEIGG